MKVYISGPITGYQNGNIEDFEAAEYFLTLGGFQVVNPHKLPHAHGKTWGEFMREDLSAMLAECNTIYMLEGWHESRGAKIEFDLAKSLEFKIMGPGMRK